MTPPRTASAVVEEIEELRKRATPGPWAYQEGADKYTHICRGPNNRFITQLSQDPTGESEATARLMAALYNSAPQLFAIARTAIELVAHCPTCGGTGQQKVGGGYVKVGGEVWYSVPCPTCTPLSEALNNLTQGEMK